MCGTEQSKVGREGSFFDGKFNLWKRKERYNAEENNLPDEDIRVFKKKLNFIPRKLDDSEKEKISVILF